VTWWKLLIFHTVPAWGYVIGGTNTSLGLSEGLPLTKTRSDNKDISKFLMRAMDAEFMMASLTEKERGIHW
jgi:hypothetical protein